MKEETREKINAAVTGLLYEYGLLQRLLFATRMDAEQGAPIALALRRLAEIADGGPMDDLQQAEQDLLTGWEAARLLKGGFRQPALDILLPAHARVARAGGLLSLHEAAELAGVNALLLDLDARNGRLHLVDERFASYEIRRMREDLATRARLLGTPRGD